VTKRVPPPTTPALRIGINALYWLPDRMGGTQTYFLKLVDALAQIEPQVTFIVFLNAEGAKRFIAPAPNVSVVVTPMSGRNRLLRLLWEHWRLSAVARGLRLDLLHSLGYLSPVWMRVPSVVTVLDMIHYLHPGGIGRAKLALWRVLFPLSIRTVSAVITISESVRRDVASLFPRVAVKSVAIPLAVDRNVFSVRPVDTPEQGRSSPFILAVASAAPHKNLVALIEAFHAIHADFANVRLVLVGQAGPATAPIREAVTRLQLADRVDFTGRIDDDSLVSLYSRAAVLVFPSRYEGFGLPILEAMACGCPVIAATAASIPEVAGDAALYFEPDRSGHLSAVLAELLSSPELAASLRHRGLERARQFSWERTARETMAVYRSVLGSRSERWVATALDSPHSQMPQ
jgi:glycosyltransferase involved in cell wall biosynthesis